MPIKLVVHKKVNMPTDLTGRIRITPQAETTLREISRETGLSMRTIASEIIVQGADMIEVVEE